MNEPSNQINPKQVRGLEEALRKLDELKDRVALLEEQAKNFVTRDELTELAKTATEAYQRAVHGVKSPATP